MTRIYKRLLLIGNLLLLAAVSYILLSPLPSSDVVSQTVGPNRLRSGDYNERAEPAGVFALNPSREDYEALIGSDLFAVNRAGGSTVESDVETGEEEEYELPEMDLLGTIAGKDPFARALIRLHNNGGEQQFFRTGDTIAGAVIERIDPRGVTLAREGHLYEIGIDFKGGGSGASHRETDRRGAVASVEERMAPTERTRRIRVTADSNEEDRQRRFEEMRQRLREAAERADDPEVRERLEERLRFFRERMEERVDGDD